MTESPPPSPLAEHWTLDPAIVFLNHGSFGATPRVVLEAQGELRARMERNPMQFFLRDLECLLDETRGALARFVDARPSDLVFVPNATTGVNAVLRSLEIRSGDELLTTDHEYNACKNVLDFVAARAGAHVVVASVPFPLASEDEVTEAIVSKTTSRTRLLLVDHVTSPTGLVLPIARIAAAMAERGLEVLVDGAHAPGMLELSLGALSKHVAFYTANCRKWLCTPKGSRSCGYARTSSAACAHTSSATAQLAAHQSLALPRRIRLDGDHRPNRRPLHPEVDRLPRQACPVVSRDERRARARCADQSLAMRSMSLRPHLRR